MFEISVPCYTKNITKMITYQQFLNDYLSLSEDAQRRVRDYIALLRSESTVTHGDLPSGTNDLEDEPFIGVWRSRKDLADSSTWVRNTRKQEWGKSE